MKKILNRYFFFERSNNKCSFIWSKIDQFLAVFLETYNVQGLKKVPSSCPAQVEINFLAGKYKLLQLTCPINGEVSKQFIL